MPVTASRCWRWRPGLTEGVAAWRDPEAASRAVRGWVAGSLETAAEPGHAVFVAELGGRIAGVVTVTGRRKTF